MKPVDSDLDVDADADTDAVVAQVTEDAAIGTNNAASDNMVAVSDEVPAITIDNASAIADDAPAAEQQLPDLCDVTCPRTCDLDENPDSSRRNDKIDSNEQDDGRNQNRNGDRATSDRDRDRPTEPPAQFPDDDEKSINEEYHAASESHHPGSKACAGGSQSSDSEAARHDNTGSDVEASPRRTRRHTKFEPRVICNPYSREDLFRRLATYTTMPAIASMLFVPRVLNPLVFAGRGWEFQDGATLYLLCEHCNQRVALSPRLSNPECTGHDKLVRNYHTRALIYGHHQHCPWFTNGCSRVVMSLPLAPRRLPSVLCEDSWPVLVDQATELLTDVSPRIAMWVDAAATDLVANTSKCGKKVARAAIASVALNWHLHTVLRNDNTETMDANDKCSTVATCDFCSSHVAITSGAALPFCPLESHKWYCIWRTNAFPSRLNLLSSRIVSNWGSWSDQILSLRNGNPTDSLSRSPSPTPSSTGVQKARDSTDDSFGIDGARTLSRTAVELSRYTSNILKVHVEKVKAEMDRTAERFKERNEATDKGNQDATEQTPTDLVDNNINNVESI